jgi:hypothetical protein
MRYVKLLVVCVVIGAYPTALALAHRGASRQERAALTRAFNAPLSRSVPEKCLRFLISTLDTAWATIGFNETSTGPPRGCAKYAADGVTIFHHHAGRWHEVGSGSSFVGANGRCTVPGVPKQVSHDLRLC